MRKLIQKRLKNQKGLTLIELLVVIVILGIIAAITVPMVMGNQSEAEEAARDRTEQLVQDAVNRYMINNAEDIPDPDELYPEYLSTEITDGVMGDYTITIGGNGIVTITN